MNKKCIQKIMNDLEIFSFLIGAAKGHPADTNKCSHVFFEKKSKKYNL